MRRSPLSLPAGPVRLALRLLAAVAAAAFALPAVAQQQAGDAAAVAPTAAPPLLPRGFQPPKPVPDVMTLKKPTMSEEEIATERAALAKVLIDRKIVEGQLSNDVKQLLSRWARLRFGEMTADPDPKTPYDPKKAVEVMRGMSGDLRRAGLTQQNENRKREFREYLYGEVTKEAEKVFDNNFYVRLQAIILLSRLNVQDATPGSSGKAEISYAPAIGPLLKVIADPQQHEGLKAAAANGVRRLARDAENVPAELRFEAGNVLTKELLRRDTSYWYQMRLADALGRINLDYDRNRKPIVVDALSAVIADKSRDWLARSAAAKALGRVPLPAETSKKAIADEVLRLGQQMAEAYNAAPSQPRWKESFANLYLTFRPGDDDDPAKLPNSAIVKQTGSGPLEDARLKILPLAKHVLSQPNTTAAQPIPADLLKPLAESVADSRP